MNRISTTALLWTLGALSSNANGADTNPFADFKIKGQTYFDFEQPVTDDGPRTTGEFSSFDFRRGYLTIDHAIDDDFTIRYRTDVDRKGGADKLRAFVKHAYVSWKGLVPGAKLYAGMVGTPTWSDYSDKYWGYRGVSKTLLDGFKDVTGEDIDVSSAAIGVSLKGRAAGDLVGYNAFVSNGRGYSKSEDDKYKKLTLQGSLHPADGLVLVALTEYEPQSSADDNVLLKGFAGYQGDGFAAGIEYFSYDRGGSNDQSSGLSAFGRYDLTDLWTPFVRFDSYEPRSETSNDETSLVIAGIDYNPNKHVHFVPNIRYYSNAGDGNPDFVALMTAIFGL